MTVSLHCTHAGDPAAPPVVILHGLFGSGSNWRTIGARLARAYHVVTVDLRNHGRSPWTDRMDYPSMAADVAALIGREGLHAPAVVGHSMGGKTAMVLALTHPALVGRLAVVDIAPVTYQDRFTPYVEAMRSVDAVHAASRSEIQSRLQDVVGSVGVTQFLMQNLVARNEHFDWRVNLAVIGASMGALSGFPDVPDDSHYDGPACVIHGAGSDYVGAGDHDRFRRLFPHVRFEAIAHAGHWVHADQPAAFLAALEAFLAAAPSAPAARGPV